MRGWEWWIFGLTWEPCNHLFCRKRMHLVDRIWYGVGVHRLHFWIKKTLIPGTSVPSQGCTPGPGWGSVPFTTGEAAKIRSRSVYLRRTR